ncbi:MAG: DUF4194 domain-containing protein [Verrucomicrobiales bacterium]
MTEPTTAHVKARLFREPLYAEDGSLWDTLLQGRDDVATWFAGVGLQLVIDEDEGYAYIQQPDGDEAQGIPRLIARRALGYEITLLLVCLRQELSITEARDADQVRLVRSRREIAELISGFLGETTDEVRDQKKIDRAIDQAVELGFLRRLGAGAGEDFEIRRIIKARLGPSELELIKKKLKDHVDE